MKEKHPDKKEILDVLLDGKGARVESVKKHLSECNNCRVIRGSFQALLEHGNVKGLMPSPGVEERILESYRKILSGEYRTPIKFPDNSRIIRNALAAASIAAVLLVVFLFLRTGQQEFRPISLTLGEVKGDVTSGGRQVVSGSTISGDGKILTRNLASVKIYYQKEFNICIQENSIFEIKKAENKVSDREFRFDFRLHSGQLYARFKKKPGMSYNFLTPHARIDSIGTQFLISSEMERSILIVTRGSVRLSCLKSGGTITAVKNREYIISNEIKTQGIGSLGAQLLKESGIVYKSEKAVGKKSKEDIGKKPVRDEDIQKDDNTLNSDRERIREKRRDSSLKRDRREIHKDIKDMRREQKKNKRENRRPGR